MNATSEHPAWSDTYQALCAGGAIGLVHDRATHHVSIETSLGRIYGRDDWAAALAAEHAGLRTVHVDGVRAWTVPTAAGTTVVAELDWTVAHTGASPFFGSATGNEARLSSSMIALVAEGRIHRAWRVVDLASAARDLGVDVGAIAQARAAGAPRRGGIPWSFGEVRATLGQLAPPDRLDAPPGLAGAAADACLAWQGAWNQRRFDRLGTCYADDATIASGATSIGRDVEAHAWHRVIGACPDAVLFLERAVADDGSRDGARVALLWRWIGTHTGPGFGQPCGARLHVRGITVLSLRQGRIAGERVVFDEIGVRRDAILRMAREERL